MAILQGSSLTNCLYIPDFIPSGTVMVFESTSAPTSWTKSTTHNDKALRIVNGTVTTTSASSAFSTVLSPSRTFSGSTSANPSGTSIVSAQAGFNIIPRDLTTVTATQGQVADISEHQHPYENNPNTVIRVTGATARNTSGAQPIASGTAGGSTQHTHQLTPTNHPHTLSQDHTHPITETPHSHPVSSSSPFAVSYRDVILASKD